MAKFDHLILTRWNVHVGHSPSGSGLQPEWLEHRIGLFERFCVPSMAGQLGGKARWIWLCDRLTPPPYRDRLVSLAASTGAVLWWAGATWRRELGALVELFATSPHLITTRVDNDDALHRDFIALVQDRFAGQRRAFVTFRQGYSYSTVTGALGHRSHAHNPFVSLIEARTGATTVMCGNHGHLHERGDPFEVLERPRAWLSVQHDRNIRNAPGPDDAGAERAIVARDFGVLL